MWRTSCALVLFGGLACAAIGCGGTFASVGAADGGGADDGGGGGDPDGSGPAPHCPSAQPTAGGACSSENLVCEYGTSPVQDCDTVATCTGGAWQFAGHSPGGLDCDPAPASQCPSSFATVPRGSHCAPFGLYCDYPQGRCACSDTSFGPTPADASAEAEWICQVPVSGCPEPRPRLGTACSQEGLDCDYGTCGVIPGGTAEACTNGIWVEELTACPATAG